MPGAQRADVGKVGQRLDGLLVVGGLVVVSPKRSSWIQSASPETPDAEQSHATGEVELAEQAASEPGDRRRRRPSARARVVERERVVKSCSRTLRVIVRPERPLLRRRSATFSGLPAHQTLHQAAVGEVGVVGALDADGLGLPLRHDRPVVLGPREQVQPVPVGLAEQPDQLVLADALEVGDGRDARAAQPLGGGRPDAGDDRDVHRAQQVVLGAGAHDDQAVGLVEVAGDLGDELRGAQPDRRGQSAGHLGDPAADLLGERPDRCRRRTP